MRYEANSIDPRELMLFNTVNLHRLYIEPKVIRVTLNEFHDMQLIQADEWFASGIELNKEDVILLGFLPEGKDYPDSYVIDITANYQLRYNAGLNYVSTGFKGQIIDAHGFNNCKFIHQLQNLYYTLTEGKYLTRLEPYKGN